MDKPIQCDDVCAHKWPCVETGCAIENAKTCMDHQCTPDYELGTIHGSNAAIHVCKQRHGSCQLSA